MEIEELIRNQVSLFKNKNYFPLFSQMINSIDIHPTHSVKDYSSLFTLKEDAQNKKINYWNLFIKKAFSNDKSQCAVIVGKYIRAKAQFVLKKISELRIFFYYDFNMIVRLYLLLCEIEILKSTKNTIKLMKVTQSKNDLLKKLTKIRMERENKEKYGYSHNDEASENYVESLLKKITDGIKSGKNYMQEQKYKEKKLLLLKRIKIKNQSKTLNASRTIKHYEDKTLNDSLLSKEKINNYFKIKQMPMIGRNSTTLHKNTKLLLHPSITKSSSVKIISNRSCDRIRLKNYLSKKDFYY